MEKVHFLHTNDIHSHLENWPTIQAFLTKRKQQLKAENETVLTIDVGDFCDRWHPLTEASAGQANTELLNAANYDLVTIGNNEGLGFSQEQLNQLYQQANFKVILTNLFDQKTKKRPTWCVDHFIIQTKMQTRIAFIGLTAAFEAGYAANGWLIQDPLECLATCLPAIKTQAEVIVLISHLGVSLDQKIAQRYPEIGVIIGGHTHHLFANGKLVGQTLLTAAEKYGHYIGEITLTIENKQIKAKKAVTYDVAALVQPAENELKSKELFAVGQELLAQQTLAKLPFDLSMEPFNQPAFSMIDAIQECLKSVRDCEVVLFNTGLVCKELKSGMVNKYDLHQCLPHLMHLVSIELSGENLVRLAGEIHKNKGFLLYYHPRGLGFRGSEFGRIISNDLSYDPLSQQGFLQGEKIDLSKKYTIVTLDYLVYLPFFPTLELTGKIELIYPKLLREYFGDYLSKKYPVK